MHPDREPAAYALDHRPDGGAPASDGRRSGCAGEVAQYRAVMANVLATGHVNKSVHARVSGEIDRAAASCAAGRDAEAVRMLDATKARYGYR